MTLTEFLLARIAEDEAFAKDATPGPWVAWSGNSAGGGEYVSSELAGYTFGVTEGLTGRFDIAAKDAAHIAHHHPARVLDECRAKRRIIGELGATVLAERTRDRILRSMAAVYSDHPDHRQWLP